MEEKEQLCIVPRNLNKSDTIVHYPIKLDWKQISYIVVGGVVTYSVFQTGIPLVYKIVASIGGVGVSLVGSFFKYEDSTIDELVIDSLHYVQKKNVYKQIEKRSGVSVTYGSYSEPIGNFPFSSAKA